MGKYDSLPERIKNPLAACIQVDLDLKTFGEIAFLELLNRIKADLDLEDEPPQNSDGWDFRANPLDSFPESIGIETEGHLWFAKKKRSPFLGRLAEMNALEDYAKGNENCSCFVMGAAGSGKSSLLAEFAFRYRQRYPETLVIEHYSAATMDSAMVPTMVLRLCNLLDPLIEPSDDEGAPPPGIFSFFIRTLKRIPKHKRILIIVDGCDQFHDESRTIGMHWIPPMLPQNVKLICSSATERNEIFSLPTGYKAVYLKLGDLSAYERCQIVKSVPLLSAKTLNDDQVDALIRHDGTGNPLFLSVVLDEMRGLASSDQVSNHIRNLSKNKSPGIAPFDCLFLRLESEFGTDVASTALCLLAIARMGLYEAEWMRLCHWALARRRLYDGEGFLQVDRDLVEVMFSILCHLRPYMSRLGMFMRFQYPALSRAIAIRWPSDMVRCRKSLVDYFNSQDPERIAEPTERRKFLWRQNREVAWQLASLGEWVTLSQTLLPESFYAIWEHFLPIERKQSFWKSMQEEVLEYWAEIERNSPQRREATYAQVLADPRKYSPNYLKVVEGIMRHAGRDQDADLVQQALDTKRSRTADLRDELLAELSGKSRSAARREAESLEARAIKEFRQKCPEAALELFKQAESLFWKAGLIDRMRPCLIGRAESLFLIRRLKEAEECVSLILQSAREEGSTIDLANGFGILALIRIQEKQFREASEALDELAEWSRRTAFALAENRLRLGRRLFASLLLRRQLTRATFGITSASLFGTGAWTCFQGGLLLALGLALITISLLVALPLVADLLVVRFEPCPKCGRVAAKLSEQEWYCRSCGFLENPTAI